MKQSTKRTPRKNRLILAVAAASTLAAGGVFGASLENLRPNDLFGEASFGSHLDIDESVSVPDNDLVWSGSSRPFVFIWMEDPSGNVSNVPGVQIAEIRFQLVNRHGVISDWGGKGSPPSYSFAVATDYDNWKPLSTDMPVTNLNELHQYLWTFPNNVGDPPDGNEVRYRLLLKRSSGGKSKRRFPAVDALNWLAALE